MPCVRFETTIPASERPKTVHALDRSATVTGLHATYTVVNKHNFTISNLILSNETLIHCDFTFRGVKKTE
jgi:hypothetical protein